jgi:hypothetical protein
MASKSDNENYEAGTRGCLCPTCKRQRLYQKMHPEKHLGSVRRYYSRNRDAILLSKAYTRYMKGMRPQKRTLIKLIDAGFPIDTSTGSTGIANLDESRSFESILTFLTGAAS